MIARFPVSDEEILIRARAELDWVEWRIGPREIPRDVQLRVAERSGWRRSGEETLRCYEAHVQIGAVERDGRWVADAVVRLLFDAEGQPLDQISIDAP